MEIARTIVAPEPVTITLNGQETKLVVSFRDFVGYLVNQEGRFNGTGPGIRAGMRIEEAAKLPVLVLSGSDWLLLRGAAEEPDCGQMRLSNGAHIGRQLLAFIDAIGAAEEEAVK